jgi:quercetin dioxygenase-like cupin family protein
MALPHAKSGSVIEIRPLAEKCATFSSIALVKTEQLEVIRMTMPRGKTMPQHKVPGDITVQCIEGAITVSVHGNTQALHAGELLFLAGGEPHALQAIEDAAVLITILLKKPAG